MKKTNPNNSIISRFNMLTTSKYEGTFTNKISIINSKLRDYRNNSIEI